MEIDEKFLRELVGEFRAGMADFKSAVVGLTNQMRTGFAELAQRIDRTNIGLDRLEKGLGETNSGLDRLETGLGHTNARLDRVEGLVEQLQTGLDTVKSALQQTNIRLDASINMTRDFRKDVSIRLDNIARYMLTGDRKLIEHEHRIQSLEGRVDNLETG